MVEKLSRRDGLKLLAAVAGGAVAASQRDGGPEGLMPVGGDGPEHATAHGFTPTLWLADSFDEDYDQITPPALVFVVGEDRGIIEVTAE